MIQVNLEPGQKCILAKWQGPGKERRPTPVIVVAHHLGEVYIVRETLTGQEYPAARTDLRVCKDVPKLKFTARQARLLAVCL